MKYLLITLYLLSAGTVFAATPIDRTIFSSLEAGKSKSYDLTLPKGKSVIAVEQMEDSVYTKSILTCTFSSDGEIGLEQKNVSQCLGKLDLKKETKLTVKVKNESTNTLDFKIKQFPIK